MERLPEDVEAVLVRAVGAYVRAAPAQELPGHLRRFKGFRPQALTAHSEALLAVLDDEAMRTLIVQWLDDKPRLPSDQAEVLRIAAQRPEGWLQGLRDRSSGPRRPVESGGGASLEQALEKEHEKVRRAREEARRARDEARAEMSAQRELIAEKDAGLQRLEARLGELQTELERAQAGLQQVQERSDRDVRKARREVDKAAEERDRHKQEASRARREAAALKREVTDLERKLEAAERRAQRVLSDGRARPAEEREPLPVPKGLLENDPETLSLWLEEPDVHLLVDGYNVSKAEGGFGDIELEQQRHLVVQGVEALARRKKIKATVVFDGSEVPPGATRSKRRAVRVEYSQPGRIADDHLVELLFRLPGDPVVVVTNDRELQERARDLGATIARSQQLLALIHSIRT